MSQIDRHFARLRPLPGEEGAGCYFIGTALAIGSGLSSVLGGLAGASAAEDAADAQVAALEGARQRNEEQFRPQIGRIDPFVNTGHAALGALATGTGIAGEPGAAGYGDLTRGFTEEDFRADPGYQFRLREGEQAINRAAAARGQYFNPDTVKELQRYGGGLADQTYGDAFNRYQVEQGNRFNRLAALMSAGQSGVDQAQNAINTYVGQNSALASGIGDARASGILNAANARISGLTGAFSSGLDQYNINRAINMYGGAAAPNAVRYPGTTYPGRRY